MVNVHVEESKHVDVPRREDLLEFVLRVRTSGFAAFKLHPFLCKGNFLQESEFSLVSPVGILN
jgi:hypothetical protein